MMIRKRLCRTIAAVGIAFASQQAVAGGLFVSSFGNGAVFLLDSDTGRVIRTYTDPNLVSPTGIALSADGQRLYVGNSNSANDVVVFNPITGTRIGTFSNSSLTFASGLALSADGKSLYAGGFSNVYRFDTTTGVGVLQAPLPNRQHDLEIAPNGSTLYAANNFTNRVYQIPLPSGTPMTPYNFGQFAAPSGAAASPDGSLLYVALFNDGMSNTNTINVYNASSGAQVNTLLVGGALGDFAGLDVSDDGTALFVSDSFNDSLYRVSPVTGSRSVILTNAQLNDPAYVLYTSSQAILPESEGFACGVLCCGALLSMQRLRYCKAAGSPRR